MGAAFLASIFFLLLVWTSFFRYFLNIVPWSLKMAIAGGIGLFVTLIGMEKGKLIVGSPTTVTMLGNLAEPTAFLTLLGLLITAVLLAYRIQAAMLLGMVAVFAAALSLGFATLPAELFSWPQGLEKAAGQLTFSFQGNMPLIILVMGRTAGKLFRYGTGCRLCGIRYRGECRRADGNHGYGHRGSFSAAAFLCSAGTVSSQCAGSHCTGTDFYRLFHDGSGADHHTGGTYNTG